MPLFATVEGENVKTVAFLVKMFPSNSASDFPSALESTFSFENESEKPEVLEIYILK